jgi:hypothetical protein
MDNDCVSCGEIDEELIDVDGIGGLCEGCFHDGAADYITPGGDCI